MAAHAPEQPVEDTTVGAGLLPIFALAVVVATIAIGAVLAAPSSVTVIIALGTVIAFAAGITVLLSRLIGPDQH